MGEFRGLNLHWLKDLNKKKQLLLAIVFRLLSLDFVDCCSLES